MNVKPGQLRRHRLSGLLLRVEKRADGTLPEWLCSYPEEPPPHGNPLRPYDEQSLERYYPVVSSPTAREGKE